MFGRKRVVRRGLLLRGLRRIGLEVSWISVESCGVLFRLESLEK